MNATELVDHVRDYAQVVAPMTLPLHERDAAIEAAAARIIGVGQDQYAEGETQRFERLPLADLLEYAREESLDLINYGTMLAIRLTAEAPDIERQHHVAKHITRIGLELTAEIDRVAELIREAGR